MGRKDVREDEAADTGSAPDEEHLHAEVGRFDGVDARR